MTFALRGRMRLAALLVLASLSGCLTPAKLAEMAQRADTLSKGAKTDECADAAANAASAVVVALGDMTRATKTLIPKTSKVLFRVSSQVGQATFLSSSRDWRKYETMLNAMVVCPK
jgi:hypothetical protein